MACLVEEKALIGSNNDHQAGYHLGLVLCMLMLSKSHLQDFCGVRETPNITEAKYGHHFVTWHHGVDVTLPPYVFRNDLSTLRKDRKESEHHCNGFRILSHTLRNELIVRNNLFLPPSIMTQLNDDGLSQDSGSNQQHAKKV
eukprot:1161909-Pelagomonas_calceolata.AAC.27